jgi:heat shock protein HtpX
MGPAGLLNRLTGYFSLLGQFLLILYIPALLLDRAHVPMTTILFLVFAPSISALLQPALSRTREFEADLGSALLTGDPKGLASALLKLEEQRGGLWRRLPVPGWGRGNALMLTHPPTRERVERLMSVAAKTPAPPERRSFPLDAGFIPHGVPSPPPRVRRGFPGVPIRYSRYI